MNKQAQFQIENFSSFNNGDLGRDLERIITIAESLYENNETLSISEECEATFDLNFGICVEGTSYWYGNEEERNKDLCLLVNIISSHCIFNYYEKDLKAKFSTRDRVLEVFHKGNLLHTEPISDTSDYWFGIDIGDISMDFNFWEDDFEKNGFSLALYSNKKDLDGFLSTDTDILASIPLETVTN